MNNIKLLSFSIILLLFAIFLPISAMNHLQSDPCAIGKCVKLKAGDQDKIIYLPLAAAMMSKTIKNSIEDLGGEPPEEPIPLNYTNSHGSDWR